MSAGLGAWSQVLRIKELEEQVKQCQTGVMCALSMLLDLKDLKTGLHATRLAEWAVRIAEHMDIRLPVMVNLDGFIISHSIETMDYLEDDEVKNFVGPYQGRHQRLP